MDRTIATAMPYKTSSARTATLVVTARERNEGSTAALRATVIAAIPGMLFLALMLYGFVNAML